MSTALTFALRELRSGVAGFRIFLACLALGVAALAAAGSTAEAFRQGLAGQSRSILGGDVAVRVEGRRFTPAERAAFTKLGRITESLGVRAMAEGPSGARRLAEVRGVDSAFPLAGTVGLQGARDLRQAFADRDGLPGAAVDPALLDRLGVRLGQPFSLGDARFVARAALTAEPDRLGRGFSLGPPVLVSRAALERSRLVEADSLFGQAVRIALPPGASPPKAVAGLQRALADSHLRIRGRDDAAAGLKRLIDQLEFFLRFIGLSALLAGGLGVASAVSSYLAARRSAIAVLKALGADGALVRNVYLLQVGALAVLGVGIGLALGAATPFALGALARDRLPVPVLFALYPGPLVVAGVFGLLAAAAFSLLPLARVRTTPPSALFRRDVSGPIGWGLEALGLALSAAGLVALTVLSAPSAAVAGVMIAGVAGAFAVLWLMGRAATWLAGKGRAATRGALRIGLANLAGPASAARTATPSIGLGVALLTAVVLLQSSLLSQVRDVAPQTAPSLVMTQIPAERVGEFDAALARLMGPLTPARYIRAPFATGRITALAGAPVDVKRIAPGQRWAFDQDVTLSALDGAPADAELTAGRWWPRGYVGPPQVALDEEIAHGAGLKLGQTLTLDILGRTLDARVAALRKIDIGKFGSGFPIVLNASALAGANLRSVAIARTSVAQETAILTALGRSFPQVNVISVREQLQAAVKIFDQLAWAVRGAAGVASLAGLLVLIGAIAASARTREREAAILKVLGAARGQVLAAYLVEFGLVGALAGAAGVALGAAAAWPVVTQVFHARWSMDWGGVAAVLAAATGVAAAGGLVSALAALARRPAPVLRSE